MGCPLACVQVAEYKYEMERMTKEMADLKKKWFDSKKREQVG
jgi:hypothetical protein